MKNLNRNRINKWVLAVLSIAFLLETQADVLSQQMTKPAPSGTAAGRALLKKYAEAGDAASQCELGRRYELGIDTHANSRLAVRWYKLAANQGLAKAEYSLGRLYSNGEGVRQNQERAAKYFRLAAIQGHPLAQHRLALAYELGQGVPQDLVEAYRWYSLAANDHGLVSSHLNLETLTACMSEAQLSQARSSSNLLAVARVAD